MSAQFEVTAKHAAKVGATGGCWPPGQCKDHGPKESEAPGTN